MVSPILLAEFKDHLHPGSWREGLPRGQGGTPANLLCRELLARGQRLTIFTLDPAVRDEVVLDGPRLRICVGPYGGPPGRRPARDFFTPERAWLVRTIQREAPDVLHAQWTYLHALAAQASGVPHLITSHDAPLQVLRHEFIPYRIAHTLMAWRVLSRARRVVSVSPYVARHLRRWMGYRGPLEVIPNGMPQALFEPRPARRRQGPGVAYASVLSGWTRLKNGEVALRAFSEVRRRRPDDELLLVGPDQGPGGLAESWARRHGLVEGVRFVGPRPHPEVLRLLAEEVDVMVHPSLEEACPMVVLEASALGLPVVGGDRSGGVPWTLDEGRAGVLTDVRSPAAVARAMHALAGAPEERAALGKRAQTYARRRFHVGVVADAYQAIYAELAGGEA